MEESSTVTSVSLGRGIAPTGHVERCQLVLLASTEDPAAPPSSHLLDELDEVRFRRGERDAVRTREGDTRVLTLAVPDVRMSSHHGRLVRGAGGWVLDDPTSKNGTIVDAALTRRLVLGDGAVIELGRTFFLFRNQPIAAPVMPHLRGDVLSSELPPWPPGLATFSPALAREYNALARIAVTSVPVVVLGETGTGKEVVARALHELSQRPGAFVAVNCGALPVNLVESELFGHRRGAFSGAVTDRAGLVRAADRGTLFLDEIGELPVVAQTAFLRVLQEQEVVPVGDERPVKVDARLCVATLRDLDAAVEAGAFRADLYGRIAGHVITLPSLRHRREDFGLILAALRVRLDASEVLLAPATMRALLRHDWPRNIRELEKILASAIALSAAGVIEVEHVPMATRAPRSADAPAPSRPAHPLDAADRELRERLVALLTLHHGNVLAVAEAMGKRRQQVYKWLKRLAVDPDDYRS
jgi:sigma-54 dependent transcriptional regulator, acetoin dehydrogenase operon transcriptional activator AcoR